MRDSFVLGVSVVSPAANTAEELSKLAEEFWDTGEIQPKRPLGKPVPFEVGVPPSKVRRCPRYVKLAVAASVAAWQDANADAKREETGTVFSTGYGPVESNAKFAVSVVDETPSLASPAIFSYTVPNSCLGQVCITQGFQGPSVMLMGGDVLEYGTLLLSEHKARYMLCGSVEEGHELLQTAFREDHIIDPDTISDGAAMLTLSADVSTDAYCKLTAFASASLPACPFVCKFSEDEKEIARSAAIDMLSSLEGTYDLILSAGGSNPFASMEREILATKTKNSVKIWDTKAVFGESLGAGYMENVAFGAALLRSAKQKGVTCRRILALGLDACGNYLGAVLEEV